MNDDLLSCKRQAVAMANSEQPPLEKNGRKKGYIKIMREIWDAKGYGELDTQIKICATRQQGLRKNH